MDAGIEGVEVVQRVTTAVEHLCGIIEDGVYYCRRKIKEKVLVRYDGTTAELVPSSPSYDRESGDHNVARTLPTHILLSVKSKA